MVVVKYCRNLLVFFGLWFVIILVGLIDNDFLVIIVKKDKVGIGN